MLNPTLDRVLCRVLPKPEKTASGIHIPGFALGRPNRCVVLRLGPGRHLEEGEGRTPFAVKPGDRVLFDPYKILLVLGKGGYDATSSAFADEDEEFVIAQEHLYAALED